MFIRMFICGLFLSIAPSAMADEEYPVKIPLSYFLHGVFDKDPQAQRDTLHYLAGIRDHINLECKANITIKQLAQSTVDKVHDARTKMSSEEFLDWTSKA
ncbi:MAG: hypothetical protein AAAC47_11775, partial [Pararhizobium sp.]